MKTGLLTGPLAAYWHGLRARFATSRPLAFSLLLHLALVFLGGTLIITAQRAERATFEADGDSGLVVDETSSSAPPEPSENRAAVAPPTVAPPIEVLITNALARESVLNTDPVKAPKPKPDSSRPGAEPLGLSTEFLPASMSGRTNADARHAALLRFGGTERTEGGAMAGLRWLKGSQNKDGSWGRSFAPALTGLALLCFLGHGELPDSPEFGANVRHCIDWLVANGARSSGRLSMMRYFDQRGPYEHAIATYALAEYYTMTRDQRVRPLLGYAASYIVQGQAADGGWQYSYSKGGGGSDTSVSGWQVQALKATYLAGLTSLGVEQALDRSMANLHRVRSEGGGFGYRRAGDKDGYGLAGVGALCAYLRWSKPDPLLEEGVRFILERAESDQPVQYQGPTANLYAWYYNTQACLMAGGDAWTRWNRLFQKELLENQGADGSFPPTGAAHPIGPEKDTSVTGQIYRTTLCVLMLESFYRHLPSSQ